MPDLRDTLRAAADAPSRDEFDRVDLRRRVQRIRGRRRGLAALIVLVIGLGGWVIARPIDPDARVEFIDRVPGGGREHSIPASWRRLPTAPLTPRWGSYVAWTGDEFVVWGGYAHVGTRGEESADDGAAYDPDTGRWRQIADAPVEGMWGGASVWTGDELWVLTGNGDPNGYRSTTVAAAYNPAADTWRRLPDAPAPIEAAAWSSSTGQVVVVEHTRMAGAGARRAWTLAADGDRWRPLPDTPILPGGGEADRPFAVATVDGAAYVVTTTATFRIDLDARRGWARLPDRAGGHGRGDAPMAVGTGDALLTVNGHAAALLEPNRDGSSLTWSAVPRPPIPLDATATAVAGPGGSVLAVDASSARAAAFDVTRRRWSEFSSPPLRPRWEAAIAGGTDRGTPVLFLWGGSDNDNRPFVDGAALRGSGGRDVVQDTRTAESTGPVGVFRRSCDTQIFADVDLRPDGGAIWPVALLGTEGLPPSSLRPDGSGLLAPIKVPLWIDRSASGPVRLEIAPEDRRYARLAFDPAAWRGWMALDDGDAATVFQTCHYGDLVPATGYDGGFLVDGRRCVDIVVTDEGTTRQPVTAQLGFGMRDCPRAVQPDGTPKHLHLRHGRRDAAWPVPAADPTRHEFAVITDASVGTDVEVWLETQAGARLDVIGSLASPACRARDRVSTCTVRLPELEGQPAGLWTAHVRKRSKAPVDIVVTVDFARVDP